ncbi:MAG: hypothetical protein WCP36_04370 [Methanomicrobiales archaeon]
MSVFIRASGWLCQTARYYTGLKVRATPVGSGAATGSMTGLHEPFL